MTKNIYTNLYVDDESADKSTEHIQRKAEKKLKEIERLKTKPNLTPEEIEKINTEKKWKRILHIFTPLNIYNGTPGGRLNRDLRATLPINELKGNPPSEGCPILNLHRCNPDPPEKTEKSKKRKQKPPNKEQPKQPHFAHIELSAAFSKQYTIQDEFEELFCKNNNVDKTFRQLSIKYHPDKNPDKKQWAETMQKELGGVRDAYAKR